MEQTFTDRVYFGIKRALANGDYDLNDFIIEKEVAEKYGVSKGTASEALHRLCMEGELISYPRKGYLIKVINETEHRQIQRLRFNIESLVIRILIETKSDLELEGLYQIIENREPDKSVYFTENTYFHMSMAEMTGDKFIQSALMSLVGALSHSTTYFSVVRLSDGNFQCHKAIVDCICRRDAEAAINYLKEDMKITDILF
jgi:DNA-binding GntR family transcriptional regulator